MVNKFLILTHVNHFLKRESLVAYAPYVKEMNLWLAFVKKVEIVAPRARGKEDLLEQYEHEIKTFSEIPSFNLLSARQIFASFLKIPVIGFRIFRAMKSADHLHLRCPGNIGLLACICQIFFPGKPKTAKYAGNWDPRAVQPLTYRLQRWILSNTFLTRNMQVLVYGDWPKKSKNVRCFFTASFSEQEIEQVRQKVFEQPYIFLFIGSLVEGKRPLESVRLVEELHKRYGKGSGKEVPVKLEIYGEGPERQKLETYVKYNRLNKMVVFRGSQPLEELKTAYQKAHFVILPSRSEGWPKAIAEAMFFGCIPIATPVSCVPWMLGSRVAPEGKVMMCSSVKRGVLITVSEKGLKGEEVEKVLELIQNPEEMKQKSEAAKEWSQQYTVEKFEAAIHDVLNHKQQTINYKY